MRVLRPPVPRFADPPGLSSAPHYTEIDGLRIPYVDEGPPRAPPILLLHGEPTWSYLYRKMIPPLVAKGHRVVAPDLVGFGRSDKPAERGDYTYQRHVDWMAGVLEALVGVVAALGGLVGPSEADQVRGDDAVSFCDERR